MTKNELKHKEQAQTQAYLINDPFKSTGCQSQFIDGLTHFRFWEIRNPGYD